MVENLAADRIVLGAAALGQPYGIANPPNLITQAETEAVLSAAWSRGIRQIDTAPLYGEAEKRIGQWTECTGNSFRTISKLPPMKEVPDAKVEITIRSYVDSTCQNMHIEKLEGYLLHDPDDFVRPYIRQTLRVLQVEGRCGFTGISVYRPEDVTMAVSIDRVDALQLPMNLFDNRFVESGLLETCDATGVRVFARSVFLQGLVFRDPNTLPDFFAPIQPQLHAIQELSNQTDFSLPQLVLAYVLQMRENDHVVLGCRHASEVDELCDIVEAPPLEKDVIHRLCKIGAATDVGMIDPRQWPRES
jgi:aryl-alcohol dehydrogenase-like predicted oxidoreductase